MNTPANPPPDTQTPPPPASITPAAGSRALLAVAVAGNIVLAAILGLALWAWHAHWGPFRQAAPLTGMALPAPASGQPAASAATMPAGNPLAGAAGLATESGPALAPVQLSPQRLQSIGVTTALVKRRPLTDDLRVVGNVVVDERGQAYVQTRFAGWIQNVFVNANYQPVRVGQPLFTIYSPDVVTTEREYLLARQNAQLLAASPVPGVAAGARSLLAATLERLRQWNLPRREIEALQKTGKVQQYLEVDSPAPGFVTERNALPNLYVQPSTRLYTIADLSTVWVYAQVYQNDLGQLRVGDSAQLTVDSYPGRRFSGRVDFIYPDVDLSTRTARVRLVFPNPGLLLKPGMFVNAELKLPLGSQIAVPASAVIQSGENSVVFLDRGHGYLQPRNVTLGPAVNDEYVVLHGLRPGERIVTSANFLVDSESQLQASLNAFAPPPPATMAGGEPAPADALTLITQPTPPRQGTNRFEVHLSDTRGRGIAGAQVTLRFLQPAMPAMGMAAQQAQFSLSDQGAGVYRGAGDLPAAGTWQVSVTARQGGKVIATKQISLSANGGTE